MLVAKGPSVLWWIKIASGMFFLFSVPSRRKTNSIYQLEPELYKSLYFKISVIDIAIRWFLIIWKNTIVKNYKLRQYLHLVSQFHTFITLDCCINILEHQVHLFKFISHHRQINMKEIWIITSIMLREHLNKALWHYIIYLIYKKALQILFWWRGVKKFLITKFHTTLTSVKYHFQVQI